MAILVTSDTIANAINVWLKYKEPSDPEYDYEVIDLTSVVEDHADFETGDDLTEEIVTKGVLGWLNEREASIRGDYWYGDVVWEWTLVDQPPLDFFLTNIKSARIRVSKAIEEANEAMEEMLGHYPDFMTDIGGPDAERSDTCEAQDQAS